MGTTVIYNDNVLTQLAGGRSGVIDFANERMLTDLVIEATEEAEVFYGGVVLGKGRKIIIHCAGKIMREELRIATSGKLQKLDAPVIRIAKALDAPIIYLDTVTIDGGTVAILGEAILGKAILGDDGTYAILGRAILGKAILGKGSSKQKLDTPVITLVSGDKLGTPIIELVSGEKLNTPVIYLDTGLEKLTAPTIYIETESDLIKLDTPTIYIEIEDEPDEPELTKLIAPEIYLYVETEPEPDEPDEPIVIKLDTPVIYIESDPVPDEPDEPEVIKLDTPEIYLHTEEEPETPKLAAPEIRLEEIADQVAWQKFSCNETSTYTQTDTYVGETGANTLWDGNMVFTEYTFDEEKGFYTPNGFDNYVTLEDASQAAGTYFWYNNEDGFDVEEGVWQHGAIIKVHDQYGDIKGYTYETTCVASADVYIEYDKGTTDYGIILADEGALPEEGTIIEQGENYYIIRVIKNNAVQGVYYYERTVAPATNFTLADGSILVTADGKTFIAKEN